MNRSSPSRLEERGAPGFSLIELMISLAAGLIVSTAVIAFLMSSFKSNGDFVQSTQLTQALRNTMDLVTRDLRRAGYDEYSMSYLATGAGSPFSRLRLCDASDNCAAAATPPNTCVIYAYDKALGTPGTVDTSTGEVRGLRLKQRTANNRLVGVMEYAVSTGAIRPVCSGAGPDYDTFPTACNTATGWCALTDPTKLDITTFTLTDVGSAPGGAVQMRQLNVVLRGRLAGSTEYIRGLRSTVRIRSDCFDGSLANCSLSP